MRPSVGKKLPMPGLEDIEGIVDAFVRVVIPFLLNSLC